MWHRFKMGLFLAVVMLLAACQSDTLGPPRPANTAAPTAPVVIPTNTLPPAGASAPEAPGSIFGWVWHDECAVSGEGGSVTASAGCAQSGGSYHANGAQDVNEQPIGGVKIQLGKGACPSSMLLAMNTITTDVSYGFTNLKPGTYCITIDPLGEPSSGILLPGSWTYPAFSDGPISATVTLASGENKYNVNFGWDYQFLPAVEEACTYRAAFLGDVTMPDNTVTAPGSSFIKTWRLRNDGTCAWGPNTPVYAVTNINSNSFGAPAMLPMPVAQPGAIVDLSINMVAPNAPGIYRSEWMFMVKEGGLRGVGAQGETPLYTQIVVQNPQPACIYRAAFLGDASVPDNSPIAADAPFIKIWNVRNDSNCAWGPGQALHSLTFLGGNQMNAPASVEIPWVVQPGQTVELSVPLVSPNLPGTYRNEWKLKVDNGPLIGVGPGGHSPLYVQIVVPSNAPCAYRATFLGDVTIPDNSLISPGQPFRKTWRLRNDGTCAWGENTMVTALTNVNNQPLGAPMTIGIPSVPPGSVIDLSIDMIGPYQAGTHRSEWMFMVNEGGLRGVGPQGESPLYAQIVVPGLP